jgi:hypothetical protein
MAGHFEMRIGCYFGMKKPAVFFVKLCRGICAALKYRFNRIDKPRSHMEDVSALEGPLLAEAV